MSRLSKPFGILSSFVNGVIILTSFPSYSKIIHRHPLPCNFEVPSTAGGILFLFPLILSLALWLDLAERRLRDMTWVDAINGPPQLRLLSFVVLSSTEDNMPWTATTSLSWVSIKAYEAEPNLTESLKSSRIPSKPGKPRQDQETKTSVKIKGQEKKMYVVISH